MLMEPQVSEHTHTSLAVCPIAFHTLHTVHACQVTLLPGSSLLSIPSIRSISPSQLHVVRSLDSGQRHGWAVLLAWLCLAVGKVGGLGPPSMGLEGLER